MRDVVIKIIEKLLKSPIDSTSDLFQQGLDSISVLRLIVLIEEEFNVSIDDDDLTVEILSYVDSIVNMVRQYEH